VDGHAIGIEVGDLERNDFTHPEAGGVRRGQQQAVAGARACGEEPPHILAAQEIRELLGLLRRGDVEVSLRMAEGDVVEKPERVRRLRARAPGELPSLKEVGDVRLHLVGGELVR
jgi:hypothetical protein